MHGKLRSRRLVELVAKAAIESEHRAAGEKLYHLGIDFVALGRIADFRRVTGVSRGAHQFHDADIALVEPFAILALVNMDVADSGEPPDLLMRKARFPGNILQCHRRKGEAISQQRPQGNLQPDQRLEAARRLIPARIDNAFDDGKRKMALLLQAPDEIEPLHMLLPVGGDIAFRPDGLRQQALAEIVAQGLAPDAGWRLKVPAL